jgi:hypothetical protein
MYRGYSRACHRMVASRQRATTLHRQLGRSLLVAPAHARQEARKSSLERTARAIAGSRNVRTGKAREPGLPGTPRGPRARTDHTPHSSPATCQSAAGPRCPARCAISICSPRHICVPSQPPARPLPPPPGQSWSVRRQSLSLRLRGDAPGGRLRGQTYRAPAASPPIHTERPPPGQIQAGPAAVQPQQPQAMPSGWIPGQGCVSWRA